MDEECRNLAKRLSLVILLMEPIIKTEGLKVIYNKGKDNEYIALNGIDIEVYPEEYLIFFGPSGCGKSTLLYTILGFQRATEGKVYIKGQDSSVFSEKEKNKTSSQFFGIVFQNFNLINSLNVIDNIMLPQVFVNAEKEERKEKAMVLLKRFGIETRAHNLPFNLSGGQQQRVAICRALINDPSVLLADEPVGNLDSESARVVMETLKDINRNEKKTVILVTHDASYLPYADRIYYFKDAKLERMVKNKRTEQGQSTANKKDPLISELEKLAHVHSFMTVPQLKAWSITNYLTERFTVDQTERLEAVMEQMLGGKISQHHFFEKLNSPYAEGGVGMYKATAISYTLRIAEILKEVKACLVCLKNKSEEGKPKMVKLLRKFLISDYHGHLNKEHIERLDKVIYNRAFGLSSEQEFRQFLNLPIADGGVGLHVATAERLAERLEIILAQLYEAK